MTIFGIQEAIQVATINNTANESTDTGLPTQGLLDESFGEGKPYALEDIHYFGYMRRIDTGSYYVDGFHYYEVPINLKDGTEFTGIIKPSEACQNSDVFCRPIIDANQQARQFIDSIVDATTDISDEELYQFYSQRYTALQRSNNLVKFSFGIGLGTFFGVIPALIGRQKNIELLISIGGGTIIGAQGYWIGDMITPGVEELPYHSVQKKFTSGKDKLSFSEFQELLSDRPDVREGYQRWYYFTEINGLNPRYGDNWTP